jgi:anti-anti-sigma factor
MNIEFRGDDATVAFGGDFTFTDHVAFREAADRLFKTANQPLVIDLTGLEFIDSAGLGMLLIAREEASKAGRSLALHHPQGQVARMFAVTKFDTLFTIVA